MGRKATLKPQRATERATQRQIGGKHYKDFKIQPIEFITKNKLSLLASMNFKGDIGSL